MLLLVATQDRTEILHRRNHFHERWLHIPLPEFAASEPRLSGDPPGPVDCVIAVVKPFGDKLGFLLGCHAAECNG